VRAPFHVFVSHLLLSSALILIMASHPIIASHPNAGSEFDEDERVSHAI
jgi:hypothetical protein